MRPWLPCATSTPHVWSNAASRSRRCAISSGTHRSRTRTRNQTAIGTTIVLSSFGGSTGGILFDPSLDIKDVEADLKVVTTGLGYTFDLAGRQARVVVVLPVAWGAVSSDIDRSPQRHDVAGLLDPRLKLSIGLRGAPALTRAEFARTPKQTAVGTSITIVAPVGQYSADQVRVLGSHRWAFKPEIGISRAVYAWSIDGYAGVWLFTTNDAYFPGHTRKSQDPCERGELHHIRASAAAARFV